LSAASVSDLFKPSLTEKAAASIAYFPDSQWSVGLCLAKNDWPGRRKKGSGYCRLLPYHDSDISLTHAKGWGWAGTYYFLDPTTGIAVVFGTQVVPPIDTETVKLWEEVEKVIYAGLGV